jgi:hypothetical protein
MSQRIDDDLIVRLLCERDMPWARVARSAEHVVEVGAFLRFGARHSLASEELEPAMDGFVRRHGGSRERTVDPWSWLPNLIRLVVGKPRRAPEQLWVLPSGVLPRPPANGF